MNEGDELRTAVLELGCAEIPAAYLPGLMRDLQEKIRDGLDRVALPVAGARTFATPRRLVALLEEVPARGRQMTEEVRGPSVDVAYDEDGTPTRAAEGFARGQGVTVQDLQTRSEDRGDYVYAVHRRPGRPAVDALGEIMEAALEELRAPRNMRWGTGEHSFARPVRWLVALWGDEVIPVQFAGARAGRRSRGPRFRPETVEVPCAENYLEILEDAGVVVDQTRRRRRIVAGCRECADEVGGEARPDEAVLDEVTYLVEYPTVVRGDIPAEFMDVPRMVVITAMQAHLRFFPIESAGGDMLPHFLSVINGTQQMRQSVRRGNELVLHARLADAKFFWDEDTGVRLTDRTDQLADVVVHEKLGTYADKVERLRLLGERVAGPHLADPTDASLLDRAARLCKADLVTNMVAEFPSLQGRMGEEYARIDGEDERVCRAIGEHYLPAGSDDLPPQTELGRWLSLLDKADHLTGGFLASLSASGSEDPYGLRRVAAGIVRILAHLPGVSVRMLLEAAVDAHDRAGPEREQTVEEAARFVRQRLRRMMRAAGYSQHLTEGILAAGFDDVADVWSRAEAISRFLSGSSRADDFLVAWRRCHNLAGEGEPRSGLDAEEFTAPEARALCERFVRLRPRGERLLCAGRYGDFCELMAELREPVDAALDSVMIMASDQKVRRRRLALLAHIDEMLSRPMDWSKLPG